MVCAEQRNHSRSFLRKAEEYLAAAEDCLAAERHTPTAGVVFNLGTRSYTYEDRLHILPVNRLWTAID